MWVIPARVRFALRNAACFAFALSLAGCATFRIDVERVSSEAWPRPDETTLGRDAAKRLTASPGQSGFRLLDSGLDAFAARAALAEAAERTLDLQYYIIREDMTTQLLLYEALRAADRGVRVRLLVDDMYAVGKDFDLATFSAHPNIEVRVFNPFLARGPLGLSRLFEFIGSSARLNRRMHNKLWIADNAAAIVGGRNLGDEYFDAHVPAHVEVNFTDLDVLALGPVVRETSKSFDDYWNSEWAMPIEAFVATPPGREQLGDFAAALAQRVEQFRDTEYARELRDPRFGRQLRRGELPVVIAPAEVLYDDPGKAVARGDEAQPSLITLSVRTRIESAELGAQVAKLFEDGVDPADAFRVELAARDRPEAGLVWLAEEDGKPVRYTSEPASFWKRFAAGLLSLFAPEHML